MIRLIVGLGNPGKDYVGTRHNLGRRVVEVLAGQLDVSWRTWHTNQVADYQLPASPAGRPTICLAGRQADYRLTLLLPESFMNLSGEGVGEFVRFHKLELNQVVIVHDELDVPLGTMQFKLGGSSAGHKGVQSIIDHLGTDQFWRLRLGIGRPVEADSDQKTANIRLPARQGKQELTSDFVLGRFLANEEAVVTKSVDGAVRLLVESLENEPQATTRQTE